jgi:hypothetical protein
LVTSYITPALLAAQPGGLSWNVVPTLTASSQQQQAQLSMVCGTATSMVDTFCRQPLRATVNTETLTGPGKGRLSVDPDTGIASLITRRWPVAQVLAVQTSPSRSFPPSWTGVAVNQTSIRYPVLSAPFGAPQSSPSGGNVIDLAPGVVPYAQDRGQLRLGRGQLRLEHAYLSGWAHAGTTGMVLAGAMTMHVDDVTGWAGASGYIYDGTSTEPVTVTTIAADSGLVLPGIVNPVVNSLSGGALTVQAGPGTVTLASPLAYGHGAGTVLSALPETALRAAALFCAVQAIETIDAIATQSLSGEVGSTSMLRGAAEDALCEFRRVA